jgi:hypothetical protein
LNGICTKGTDVTKDIYARSDYKEWPRTTATVGECTHVYEVNGFSVYEDAIKVSHCKELAGPAVVTDTFSECVYKGVFYDTQFTGFNCGTTTSTATPRDFGGNSGGNATVVTAATKDLCEAACSQAR